MNRLESFPTSLMYVVYSLHELCAIERKRKRTLTTWRTHYRFHFCCKGNSNSIEFVQCVCPNVLILSEPYSKEPFHMSLAQLTEVPVLMFYSHVQCNQDFVVSPIQIFEEEEFVVKKILLEENSKAVFGSSWCHWSRKMPFTFLCSCSKL